MKYFYLALVFLSLAVTVQSRAPFGPKYPITASWFKYRFTFEEWNQTLTTFSSIGGDTVLLKAPPIMKTSDADLKKDPDFKWCRSSLNHSNDCFEEARQDLTAQGLQISTFAVYKDDEDYGASIMRCPSYDRRMESGGRVYYRIVLPTSEVSDPCHLPEGSNVVVLFTVFTGVDPHELLGRVASMKNTAVYFGLPAFPLLNSDIVDQSMLSAYFEWTTRILLDHSIRYNKSASNYGNHIIKNKSIYDTILGYYVSDQCCLGNCDVIHLSIFSKLTKCVHKFKKKVVLSPFVDLRRSNGLTLDDHVRGYDSLLRETSADVISLQEGRGFGRGCYYWPTESKQPIITEDEVLFKVLRRINPQLKMTVTFDDIFTGSNNQLFTELASRQETVKNRSELWLNIEAFENLADDPCLPVHMDGSDTAGALNRASKGRIERSIASAGDMVQRIAVSSWDPDFTCRTNTYNNSLVEEINANAFPTIISRCSFHNEANLSVILVGYNFEGPFTVDWPDKYGERHINSVYGYYFELDYGYRHNMVPSVEYTQLWDVYEISDLSSTGYIKITPYKGFNNQSCIFVYDEQ